MGGKKYSFGISTAVDYTVPIVPILEAAAACGFEFISFGADPKHIQFNDPEGFRRIMRTVTDLGLHLASAHVPFGTAYDIADPDDDRRRQAIDRVAGFVETCRERAIPAVILHPHHYLSVPWETACDLASDSLNRLLGVIGEGIEIIVENLPDHRGSRICSRILDTFDSSQIGWCYDSSHENMSGSPRHLLESYYDRIVTTHLSDNHGLSDEHLIPGDGNIDWPGLRQWLDKTPGFTRVLFEVGTGDKLNEPVDDFIKRAADAAAAIFAGPNSA